MDSALVAKYRAEAARALSETLSNFGLLALYAAGAYAILEVVRMVRSLM